MTNGAYNIILESTGTKLMYSLILFVCTAIATLINSSKFTEWLTKYEHNGSNGSLDGFCTDLNPYFSTAVLTYTDGDTEKPGNGFYQ